MKLFNKWRACLAVLSGIATEQCSIADFYVSPPECPAGTTREVTPIWKVPPKHMPQVPSHQGATGTCTFHAGTQMLNSLRRAIHQNPTCVDLSTLDSIFEHGDKESRLTSTEDNIGTFLLKVSQRPRLSAHPAATVKEAEYVDQRIRERLSLCKRNYCMAPSGGQHTQCLIECCQNMPELLPFAQSGEDMNSIVERILKDTSNPTLAVSALLRSKKEEIFNFKFRSYDFFNSDLSLATEEVKKIIVEHGKTDPLLLLGLGTCYKEQPNGSCQARHAVTASGVDQVKCLKKVGNSVMVQSEFQQIHFLNSYGGDFVGPYELTQMAKGIAKHSSIYEIFPCLPEDLSCQTQTMIEDASTFSLLYYSSLGELEAVKKLLKNGAKCNQKMKSGLNALLGASQNGHLEVVRELLSCQDIDPNAGVGSLTPLRVAMHPEIAREILKHPRTHPDPRGFWEFLKKVSFEEGKRLILEKSQSLNHHDPLTGETLLHIVLREKRSDFALALIKARAHLDVRDARGSTPLNYSLEKEKSDVARAMIEAGADLNLESQGVPPLITALWFQPSLVPLMLSKKIDLNQQDRDGLTGLMHSARIRSHQISTLLIQKGAKLDIQDSDGNTALHHALSHRNNEFANLLIHSGAKIDLPDHKGRTPLYLAIVNGNRQLAKLLIEKGAQFFSTTSKGDTPYHAAERLNLKDLVDQMRLKDPSAPLKEIDKKHLF